MSFENTFSTDLIDYSRDSEIADTKYKGHTSIKPHFEAIFNYESKFDNDIWDDFETLRLLNFFMEITTGKSMKCRMQLRLPFSLEKEEIGSSYFQQLAECTKTVFESLPDGFIPDIEKIDLSSLEEVDPNRQIRNWGGIIVDVLGEYHPRTSFQREGEPYISLDIKKIKQDYPNEKINSIAIIIFIHELCHALLDPNNYFKYAGHEVIVTNEKGEAFTQKEYSLIEPKVKYNTLYGCCKEEAIANCLTYQIIQKLNDETLLRDAEEFMSNQKGAYLYGYLLAKKGSSITPDEWMEEKINGPIDASQWLKSMWLTLNINKAPFSNPKRNEVLDFCVFTKEQIEIIRETFSPMAPSKEEFESLFSPIKMKIIEPFGKIELGTKSIVLPPIHTSFYILLLMHPEGICNTNVEEYEDEMKRYYDKIGPMAPNSKNGEFQGLTKEKASEYVSRINTTMDSAFSDLPYIGRYYIINKGKGRNDPWSIEYTETDLYPKLQEELKKFFQ